MGCQLPGKTPIAGFPEFCEGVIADIGKDRVINLSSEADENVEEPSASTTVHPRSLDCLWRPWYAKLWWAAIPVYWLGMAASFQVVQLQEFYTSALAGFLHIAFFPPLALMVLGLGFAREWLEWTDWESVEPTHEQMFPKRSVGGMRDPYADPLDPRSGPRHWRYLDRSR